jgi:hypothetical protein
MLSDTVREYMDICEDLNRKLAEKDARIAELEAERDRTWRRLAAAMREVSVGSSAQVFDLAELALKHWRQLMDDAGHK